MWVYLCVCVLFQVLRYLLPAAGLQTQDDPGQSGSDAQRLLAHSHFHLLPSHHAKLERHRHRGYCESSLSKIGNQGVGKSWHSMSSKMIAGDIIIINKKNVLCQQNIL